MDIDWSKAPEGTKGFCPRVNGYVDHWVKWKDNGDNWFCVQGFESGGWVKAVTPMCEAYKSVIVAKPEGLSQIAADERESEIKAMADIYRDAPGLGVESGIAALYDAGYRKLEIIEGDV